MEFDVWDSPCIDAGSLFVDFVKVHFKRYLKGPLEPLPLSPEARHTHLVSLLRGLVWGYTGLGGGCSVVLHLGGVV